MVIIENSQGSKRKTKYTPTKTPKAKENQLISMAFDLAAKKLSDGTASSQLITHFLKLATEREELERKRIQLEADLAAAKINHMESQSTSQELFEKALKAFASYSGKDSEEEETDDE